MSGKNESIVFIPLGGANEIGANSYYLNMFGTGVLLDCGIDPRKKGNEALPAFNLLENLPLDFVFISHAHQDHIGALPFLVQKFPHAIIYSTPQTKEISEVTLHNAANILAQQESDPNNFRIYTHNEIDLLVRSIRDVKYNEVISLKGMRHSSKDSIDFSFHDAGHILGSASILIKIGNTKILFTGDINYSNQKIMVKADLEKIYNVDVLIVESTYGSTDSSELGTWKSEMMRLAKSANQILHRGGSVLIPVFSLGKTQEILSTINYLLTKRILTESRIYGGGVSKQISKLYDRNRYLVRNSDSNDLLSDIMINDLFEIPDFNTFKKENGIVVASSGMMLEGTMSYKLADYFLKQKNFAIYGVGYMDPETPGYKIMNSKKGDKLQLTEFSKPFKVNCEIDRFYFPSHSKREDLLEIVKDVNPKKVILVHGDENAKNWLGQNILQKFLHIKVHSAQNYKEIKIQ